MSKRKGHPERNKRKRKAMTENKSTLSGEQTCYSKANMI